MARISRICQGARPTPRGYGEVFKQILEYIHSTISEIKRAPKPFVAAVDGIAAAGGFGIAMACDLVFASDRASFEWAYGKTGLTGAESSTFFLPRLLGLHRAMELVLLESAPRRCAGPRNRARQRRLRRRGLRRRGTRDRARGSPPVPPGQSPSPRASSTRRPGSIVSTTISTASSSIWRASPTAPTSRRASRPSSRTRPALFAREADRCTNTRSSTRCSSASRPRSRRTARRRCAACTVQVGEAPGVEVELLAHGLRASSATGTLCADAELSIVPVPGAAGSARAALAPIRRGAILRCPDCAVAGAACSRATRSFSIESRLEVANV